MNRPPLRNVLEVTSWHTPCSDYAERTVGDYRLKQTEYREGTYRLYRVGGFSYFRVAGGPIPVMSLEGRENGEWRQWMIDDPFNYMAMREYCKRLSGRVLTSGLGLGIAATALAENPAVTEIVVVERSPEVIELISRYVPERVKITQDDFWNVAQDTRKRLWRKPRWDGILLDIWRSTGMQEHEEVRTRDAIPAKARLEKLHPGVPKVLFGFAEQTDLDIQFNQERKSPHFTTRSLSSPDRQFAR